MYVVLTLCLSADLKTNGLPNKLSTASCPPIVLKFSAPRARAPKRSRSPESSSSMPCSILRAFSVKQRSFVCLQRIATNVHRLCDVVASVCTEHWREHRISRIYVRVTPRGKCDASLIAWVLVLGDKSCSRLRRERKKESARTVTFQAVLLATGHLRCNNLISQFSVSLRWCIECRANVRKIYCRKPLFPDILNPVWLKSSCGRL